MIKDTIEDEKNEELCLDDSLGGHRYLPNDFYEERDSIESFEILIKPHRFPGIFIIENNEYSLVTKSFAPGHSVYQEKRISIQFDDQKIEYRVWDPYRSNIAAAIINGIEQICFHPGIKVLYLGAASGITVSHISDIIGPEGAIYAVEFSHSRGRELVNMAKIRTNIIPIINDARHPNRYRILVPMVDAIFADLRQTDQAKILACNAENFLKYRGQFMILMKAKCIDMTLEPMEVFNKEVDTLYKMGFKPKEMVTLEPFDIGSAILIGEYQPLNNYEVKRIN